MNLYKITGASYEAFFGVPAFDIARDDVTIIAQTPNCDAFLLCSRNGCQSRRCKMGHYYYRAYQCL